MNQDLPKFRDLPYDCSCGGEGMAPVSRVPGNTGVDHLPMPRLRPRRDAREAERLRLRGLITIKWRFSAA